jgi:hypothetical protein
VQRAGTHQQISGFIDNITTLLIKHNATKFLWLFLEQDAKLWERLLYTIGGKLEITKCKYALITWEFDKRGVAQLINDTKSPLHLRDSSTNTFKAISQISTGEAYKYVGAQLAIDGNMRAQIEDLEVRCSLLMCSTFSQHYFNAQDANLGYTTLYSPSVGYALPVTSITLDDLRKIQRPAVNPVHSRLGYNKRMRRAVVFSSKVKDGIGFSTLR